MLVYTTMQYKLRNIVNSKINGKTVRGITITDEIAMFFEGCSFTQMRSGTTIILTSGAVVNPSKREVEAYKFQDCRCV